MTPDTALRRPPHVVFLIRSFGFPEGTAATNRVRLLGRALKDHGAAVSVVCMRVSERTDGCLNHAVRGTCEGIDFFYATGATVRSNSFLIRRYREARGYFVSLGRLWRLHRSGDLDCVYLAALPEADRLSMWLALRFVASLGVPVVVELNELPSAVGNPSGLLTRRFPPLDGVRGTVVISAWLSDWVAAEAARTHHPVKIIEVPIVVDVDEQDVTPYPEGSPMFVYSASTGYDRHVTFVLNAMRLVWQKRPDCRLTVTGMAPQRVAAIGAKAGMHGAISDRRVVLTGYVDRADLLEYYRSAAALLIPLFDDLRSRARFPTKIGEYLSAARPIVTSEVGEIPRYFTDGETAYLAAPGDVAAFAAKMVEVLDDPKRAAMVGSAGRLLAEHNFRYTEHGRRLFDFMGSLAPTSRGQTQ
jgi:glycosyltransferase involved in cell wall biosynthesis